MRNVRYKELYEILKQRIQVGQYEVGDAIPSENELCREFSITRTTARSALGKLVNEGFIDRFRGRRALVRERRLSLGLLNVKGFSEAAGSAVSTEFLTHPHFSDWPENFPFSLDPQEMKNRAIGFSRLRSIHEEPVMWEKNWFSSTSLPGFLETEFTDDSFFRTLSKKYLVEITGSEHELRALGADRETAGILRLDEGRPVLQVHVRFRTSNPNLTIYSILHCNTDHYPIENKYLP